MAKKVMIEVGGKKYPCYRTMRAMVDQSREKLDLSDFEHVLKSVYITIRGACLREAVDFPFEFEEFVNQVDPDVMTEFGKLADKDETDGEVEEAELTSSAGEKKS